KAIEFEARAGAGYQLIEELSLVFKPALALGRHRNSLVKPTWDGLSPGCSPDQRVSDFVAHYVFERVVGIGGGPGGKEDHRLPHCKASDPWRNTACQIRTFRHQYDANGWSYIGQPDKLCDVGKSLRIDRLQTLADNGKFWGRFDPELKRLRRVSVRLHEKQCQQNNSIHAT